MQTTDAISRFVTAKQGRVSHRTTEGYHYRLGLFAQACADLPLTPEPIEAFLAQRARTPETLDTYYRLLRAFYNWLLKRKLIAANPIAEIERPRLPRKVARSLTRAELSQLLFYPGHNRNIRAFLFFLADTGLRLSEALNVTDADFLDGMVIVRGKTGERRVPVSAHVQAMVQRCLPWPWGGYAQASTAVRRAFSASGIGGRRASAHTLRHTFVRLWEGEETLLIGICGWTSARMLQVYKPYNERRALEQHRQYSPISAELRQVQLHLFD